MLARPESSSDDSESADLRVMPVPFAPLFTTILTLKSGRLSPNAVLNYIRIAKRSVYVHPCWRWLAVQYCHCQAVPSRFSLAAP